ncbi:hypothetical protein K458DRAFT_384462 [Lentithecium fluviatile CBS 122367]|uniref:Uncharacterized protein n=1 Tax=Lentithecium fluviatile CBS 122367 TaxID=1168545 RepID=A0A6G1JCL7_9PLEO|nr:hypothetical protein K458DRAFT_384462 [Lentithecium fluviatile CBS 122367]
MPFKGAAPSTMRNVVRARKSFSTPPSADADSGPDLTAEIRTKPDQDSNAWMIPISKRILNHEKWKGKITAYKETTYRYTFSSELYERCIESGWTYKKEGFEAHFLDKDQKNELANDLNTPSKKRQKLGGWHVGVNAAINLFEADAKAKRLVIS